MKRARFSGAARTGTVCILLVIALASCSADMPLSSASGSTSGSAVGSPASPASGDGVRSPANTPGATPDPGRSNGTDRVPDGAATGPSPVALPWTPSPDVPVDAVVSPVCVRPGGSMTLTVMTRPKAGVAYIASYADNGTGAPKPYGSGYGGNDKGISDPQGRFSSVWVVSITAPPGPARVDVIVGWNNMWGYDGPTFEVAGPSGTC